MKSVVKMGWPIIFSKNQSQQEDSNSSVQHLEFLLARTKERNKILRPKDFTVDEELESVIKIYMEQKEIKKIIDHLEFVLGIKKQKKEK